MNTTFDHTLINDSAALNNDGVPHIYDKCIGCPDVGKVCNGPNMLTLPIEGVREMVKRRKTTLKLSNEELSNISGIPVATVNRFLSPTVASGFSYATVSAIVRAVIGGRESSYSFNENPCPATSSEIRQQTAETEHKLSEALEECRRLSIELDICNQKRKDQRTEIKEEDQRKIDHLLGQVTYLEERCEFLKQTAEKRYKLIVNRDWIIILLILACVALLILAVMYLSWDFTHDGAGIFW